MLYCAANSTAGWAGRVKMRIPMRVAYGVRVLVDLAQSGGLGPVQSAEIAARQAVPEPYLTQLLTSLNKFRFIPSRRGPQSGHMLAKSPNDKTLDMVMSTLECTTSPLDCIEEPGECRPFT
jgi:Rrf2 family protein